MLTFSDSQDITDISCSIIALVDAISSSKPGFYAKLNKKENRIRKAKVSLQTQLVIF